MAVTSLWHVKGSIKDVIDYMVSQKHEQKGKGSQESERACGGAFGRTALRIFTKSR